MPFLGSPGIIAGAEGRNAILQFRHEAKHEISYPDALIPLQRPQM